MKDNEVENVRFTLEAKAEYQTRFKEWTQKYDKGVISYTEYVQGTAALTQETAMILANIWLNP